jgi:hypothetical protein
MAECLAQIAILLCGDASSETFRAVHFDTIVARRGGLGQLHAA